MKDINKLFLHLQLVHIYNHGAKQVMMKWVHTCCYHVNVHGS